MPAQAHRKPASAPRRWCWCWRADASDIAQFAGILCGIPCAPEHSFYPL
jgi:hypothetical protein